MQIDSEPMDHLLVSPTNLKAVPGNLLTDSIHSPTFTDAVLRLREGRNSCKIPIMLVTSGPLGKCQLQIRGTLPEGRAQ